MRAYSMDLRERVHDSDAGMHLEKSQDSMKLSRVHPPVWRRFGGP